MTVMFAGRRLRVFGVTGENGGAALVIFPPRDGKQITFQSPDKVTHRLLYDSGSLPPGLHLISIVVTKPPRQPQGYVNIDELEVTS